MRKEAFKFEIVLTICVIVIAAVSSFLSFWSLTRSSEVNISSDIGTSIDYSDGWTAAAGFTTRLNTFSVNQKSLSTDEPLVFRKTLDETSSGQTFFIYTHDLVVNVYVGNEPLHITAESGHIKGLTGFENYVLTNIPSSANGSELRLEIYKTDYSVLARINRIMIGTGSHITKSLMTEAIFPLVVGELTTVIGIGFILLSIFVRKKLDSYLGSFYFGVFLIFMSICIIMDTPWAHIVLNRPAYIEVSLCVCHLACMPAFLAFVDASFDTEHYYPLKLVTIAVSVLLVTFSVLDIVGVISFISFSYVVHIAMILCGIIASVELILFRIRVKGSNSEQSKLGFISVIALVICGLIDIVFYYTQPTGGNEMLFSCFGLLFITAVTLRTRFVEILEMIKLGIQAGRIGKIAFTDANTGIGNVAAFKAKFEELETNLHNYKYIAIIQFDVNNLKIINDSKGHEAGDMLIKSAANIINASFGIIGTCYRTGGDEFVALVCSDHAPIVCEEAIYKFNKLIDKFNANPEKAFELRIAHGVAYYKSDDEKELTLKEVHKMADERMYSNKKMLKARYAHTPEEAVVR